MNKIAFDYGDVKSGRRIAMERPVELQQADLAVIKAELNLATRR